MKLKIKSLVGMVPLLVLCAAIQLHAGESKPNSLETLQVQAARGDAGAQAVLGGRYAMGLGVKKDHT